MPDNAAAPPISAPPCPELAALFLDLDGVLAPIEASPDGVRPSGRRTDVLVRLQDRLDGRVAIVSGRPIAEIDRICEGAIRCVSGIHGLEQRGADGRVTRAEPALGVAQAHAALSAFSRDRPGVLIEDKGLAVGLHYRQVPEAAGEAIALARALAEQYNLALQEGHMIAELKTPGSDKGSALTAFMSEAPFTGAVPVMVGDDLTDEHGFAAAAALGGFGVLVGAPRATAARYGLADSDAVLAWLDTFPETK